MSLNFLPPPLEESKPFESFEEEAILSIALDIPDYFMGVAPLLNPELFNSPHVAYAISFVIEHIQKYQSVPTRNLLWHTVRKHLTTDSDAWEDVERVIKRPADPRDLPSVKDTLTQWAKRRSYGLLYSEEAQEAYAKGDYAALEKIVNDANKISDNVGSLFWFYDQVDELFEPDASIHMKTGYPALDKMLNNGGPSPKEVVCWMAPTGVGKSILLCNNAIYQTQVGVDTLLVTFELDMIKTAARCLGALSKVALNTFHDHKIMVTDAARRTFSTNNAHLVIAELPPDECSVDDIYGIISRLRKTKGWSPKCVVIDYLELMIGRRAHENKEDYSRQKAVANQVRGLAKNENVLVFTATQTNRAGNDQDKMIGLTNVAESYGKTMPLDYIISLNQNDDERKAGKLKMFINKNRNGPKHEVIECSIDYKTMHLGQAVF